MKLTIIILFVSLFLSSCIPSVYKENDYSNKSDNNDSPKILAVKGDNTGIDISPKTTKSSNLRVLQFDEVDKTYEISANEKVLLALDNDIAQDEDLFIMTKYNKSTNKITIGLYDDYQEKAIELNQKCEVFEFRGLTEIPRIKLAKDLNPEQIIITPMFDNDCHQFGFQIRYGSVGRGCGRVARKILNRFNKCVKVKPPLSRSNNCLERVWFGVDCP